MSKRLAIIQSNYIPWKGYFDIIHLADELILFDDAQYTRRDWRNRNRIKTPEGLRWLSIPVNTKGRYLDPIKDITIGEPGWNLRHWEALVLHYGRAPGFKQHGGVFETAYRGIADERLSLVNRRLIELICEVLGIRTKISWSMDYELVTGKTERIVSLCRQAGATEYLSGPTARDYLDQELFRRNGVTLTYMDYSGYPEYPQPHPPFEHAVTILDLIFNVGARAPEFMLSF